MRFLERTEWAERWKVARERGDFEEPELPFEEGEDEVETGVEPPC